jgi:hypothetical protein
MNVWLPRNHGTYKVYFNITGQLPSSQIVARVEPRKRESQRERELCMLLFHLAPQVGEMLLTYTQIAQNQTGNSLNKTRYYAY